MKRSSDLVLAMVALSACVEAAGDDSTESVTQEAKSPCPLWGCGENSPILGPFNLHELEEDRVSGGLHLPGGANSAGIRLLGFRKNGQMYRADVVVDKLKARSLITGMIVYEGVTLAGGALVVSYPVAPGLAAGNAELQILNVHNNVTMWQGPATAVETYEINYTGADVPVGASRPVCRNAPPAAAGTGLAVDGEGKVWPNRLEAILYTGDRYKEDTKEVTAASYVAAGTWFNIGCAGGALAKLYLNRHTTASATAGYTTTPAERQTMLKMYVGDFCGNGWTFTRQGTKIHWSNNKGWQSASGNTASYESLWYPGGAVCLDTHRLHSSLNVDEASMQAQIMTACPKVACTQGGNPPSLAASGQYLMTQSAALP